MADYSGDLKYRITVDGAEASQAKLSKLGASFKSVASTVALSVAAMVSFRKAIEFAGEAMANYENAIQAIRQINAALESTGRAAEFTSKELADMASELQTLSNYGDEDILQGVTLQLLRFDAIGRDIFPRAQKLVIDLAESMGGVENAARTLGISLADPALGLTRLRRIGVAFNSQQEEQIKNFIETGKTAEAQAVLMSALEERFGGLALASVSATTQMKNAWGDYLESVGSSLSFFDGVKRGITAMLLNVAGAHDVTSKSAQLAALETQEAWGEATINIGNIIADISTEVVAVIDGVIKAFDFAGKAIPNAIGLAMDGTYLVVANAMNSIVDLIVSPIEYLFNDIDAVYAKITGKSLGITNAFDAVRIDVTGVRADISSSADDISVLWENVKKFYRTWGDVAEGIATGKFSNVDEQIKLLREGIDAQRKAIEQGLTGIDVPVPKVKKSIKGVGVNVDTTGVDNYYSTVMALNNTASQQIMDKYNEMRVALGEYLRANTESQEEYQNKLRLGQAEIAKAETAELAAEKERQMSMVESFVNSVINLNASEADAIAKKYADMRTTAAAYYADGLMSQQAFSEAITQINQAELDAITNLEAKRLDLRIQTLGSLRGFEDEFYHARITQIDSETEKLREAGLAEIEIEAWKQQQIAELEEEIRIKKEKSISEFESFVIQSNENVMMSLESTMAHSLATLISGTSSALDVWRSLWANVAQSVIAEISKIIVKALFANALLKALGIATGNIGAFFGIGTGAMTQSQGFIGPVNQADFDPFAILYAIDNNANQTTSALDDLNNTIMNLSLSPRIMIGQPAIENTLEPNIFVSAPDAPTVNVDVNPILSFHPEFMPQISLNPQIQNYIDMPQIVNNIAMPEIINRFQMPNITIPQQQSIDLSPLAHILDSIMLARQERTDIQSYGVTEMMTNTVIRQERDNSALDSLSERIDKLATAIENNKPQVYTQVIEGVPLNNAVRRAAVMANEL